MTTSTAARTMPAARKRRIALTKQQKLEVKSLVEDSGYTPAMEAGISPRAWSIQDVVLLSDSMSMAA